jgi:hypothetical protein
VREWGSGYIIYEFEIMMAGQKVKKYQAAYFWSAHLPPTVRNDYQNHPSHLPAASMGQANDYASKVGETTTYTLYRAIELYAHAGTGERGGGGMYDYVSPMTVYYSYNPDYTK